MLNLFRRWYERHFSQPGTIEFALVLICAFLIVYYLMWLVGPIVVALCIAFCLDWPVQALEKYLNLGRRLATSIVMFLFCSIVILITLLVVPQIVKQGAEFYNSIVSFSLEAGQPKDTANLNAGSNETSKLNAVQSSKTVSTNASQATAITSWTAQPSSTLPPEAQQNQNTSTTLLSNAASEDNQSLSLAASKISKDNAHVTGHTLNAEISTLHSMQNSGQNNAPQAGERSDIVNPTAPTYKASAYETSAHDSTSYATSAYEHQAYALNQQLATQTVNNQDNPAMINLAEADTENITQNQAAHEQLANTQNSAQQLSETLYSEQQDPKLQDSKKLNSQLLDSEKQNSNLQEAKVQNAELPSSKQSNLAHIVSEQTGSKLSNYADYSEHPEVSIQEAAELYTRENMPNPSVLIRSSLPRSILQELEHDEEGDTMAFKLTVSDFDSRLAHEAYLVLMQLPEPLPSMLSIDILKNGVRYVRMQLTVYLADLMRTKLMPSVVNLFTWAVYLIIVPIFTFLMLYNKDVLKKRATLFILPNNQVLMRKFWPSLHQQIAGYIRGKLLHILIITIANSIAFKLLNVNYALLLGVGVGLSVVIPYVGAVIIAIPVVLVAIFQFGFSESLIWVLVIYTLIQLLDSNVLTPMLFSKAMNLDAFSILAAILIFGGLWGFWGVFFAIPLATFIKTIVMQWPNKDVREQQKREHLRMIHEKKSEQTKSPRI